MASSRATATPRCCVRRGAPGRLRGRVPPRLRSTSCAMRWRFPPSPLPGEVRRRIELEGEVRDVDLVVLPAAVGMWPCHGHPGGRWRTGTRSMRPITGPRSPWRCKYVQLNLSDVESGRRGDGRVRCAAPLRRSGGRAIPVHGAAPCPHILVEAGEDLAAARTRAEALAARAQARRGFLHARPAELGRPWIEGAGRRPRLGDPRELRRSVRGALFAMGEGESRGPVQTQFG